MATQQNSAPSFDDMIKSARQKKKNEGLAAQIFGRSTTPRSSSFAERHGVAKRSQSPRLVHRTSSSSSITRGQRNAPYQPRLPKNNGATYSQEEGGISIKGMGSGSCIVICQNFAPGTTAADIEAVMAPDRDQSVIACRLITSSPTVIAELVFTNRDEAQKVVERFNNKKADGRLLHVYIQNATPATPRLAQQNSFTGRRGQQQRSNHSYADDGMEVDQDEGAFSNDNRDGQSQNLQVRRAAPVIEDGSYGFGEDSSNNNRSFNNRNGGRRGQGRGGQRGRQAGRLVSDSMLGR